MSCGERLCHCVPPVGEHTDDCYHYNVGRSWKTMQNGHACFLRVKATLQRNSSCMRGMLQATPPNPGDQAHSLFPSWILQWDVLWCRETSQVKDANHSVGSHSKSSHVKSGPKDISKIKNSVVYWRDDSWFFCLPLFDKHDVQLGKSIFINVSFSLLQA